MEQIYSFFQFDIVEISIISALSLFLLIQIFYYCYFYRKPLSVFKKKTDTTLLSSTKTPSVSVIIITKDESKKLEECLSLILAQDYPNYEVIVVNNGLTDDTDTLLRKLQQDHPHLYHTFLPAHSDKDKIRKKLAITIGIKAANNEVLLFTDAASTPTSEKWITSMMEEMTDEKEIILGYSFFQKTKGLFSKVARFDNLIQSLQYLSMAIRKRPYNGTYSNVAFKKHLFFDNKGFSSFLNFDYSEGLFLNHIMTKNNTAVCLTQDSFVSTNVHSLSKWKGIKAYQIKVKKHFTNFKFYSQLFGLETFSRYLFYILIVAGLVYGGIMLNWGLLAIVGLCFILRLTTQLIIISKSAKYFKAGKFYFSLILLDIIQPIYNFCLRITPSK